jgi:hypothetical protein
VIEFSNCSLLTANGFIIPPEFHFAGAGVRAVSSAAARVQTWPRSFPARDALLILLDTWARQWKRAEKNKHT